MALRISLSHSPKNIRKRKIRRVVDSYSSQCRAHNVLRKHCRLHHKIAEMRINRMSIKKMLEDDDAERENTTWKEKDHFYVFAQRLGVIFWWSLFLVCAYAASGRFLQAGNYLSLTVITIIIMVVSCCCVQCSPFNRNAFLKISRFSLSAVSSPTKCIQCNNQTIEKCKLIAIRDGENIARLFTVNKDKNFIMGCDEMWGPNVIENKQAEKTLHGICKPMSWHRCSSGRK